MHHLSIDIETYSDIDLKRCGLYRYVQSLEFQIMLFAYSWDGGPVQVIDLFEQPLPAELIAALADPGVVKHAYNAAFEWYCLSKFWSTPVDQWRCTQVHGLYCGYPAGLAAVGDAMGLPRDVKKLGTGRSLIATFCAPVRPTRTRGNRARTLPHHEPEKWELFKAYCRRDVEAEMDVERRLSVFPMPEGEQRLWEMDQLMNAYGAAVDREIVEGALHCSETTTGELMTEAAELSKLNNPNSAGQLKAWLEEEMGEELDNLNKQTVTGLLNRGDNDPAVQRMLQLRRELAKTSVKKYYAMRDALCADGRVRGLLQFYGANRTGRWAGRIIQVQNLPQNHLAALETARALVRKKNLPGLRLLYGSVPDALSQLIRTAFIPSPGNRLLVADFNAIEARVIAWLAGEQWVMDVFATHGRIYEAAASQMFGVPIEEITKMSPLRQKGKVATLALGYQGSTGALISMGALDQGLTQDELPEIVQRWRRANGRIVELWHAYERAAKECLASGRPQLCGHGVVFALESHGQTQQSFLTIALPAGRKLYYSQPQLREGKYGPQMTYMGMDQDTKKWARLETYGGKLVENVTQAIARDCLAHTLQQVVEACYAVCFTVHDELVIDARPGQELQPVLDIMARPIPWAPGLVLAGAGFECQFYQKD